MDGPASELRGGPGDGRGLVVRTAARLESLVEPLVGRLRERPPADPFTPVTIMVASRGMQRWLSHQIAQRLDVAGRGIAANLDYPFPGAVVERVLAACGAEAGGSDPWARPRLHGPVLAALTRLATHPYLRGVAGPLLSGGHDAPVAGRRAVALAQRIADVFDRYALQRPDMVRAWAAGDDVGPDGRRLDANEAWQPLLWRALVERLGDPVSRLDAAIAALGDPAAPVDAPLLPGDLVSFGIPWLPARHLELLAALGTRVPVELLVATPSPARWRAAGGVVPAPGTPAVPDVAGAARHPLLASCGRLADDMRSLVADLGATVVAQPEPAAGVGLLGALQAGVHADVAPVAPDAFDAGDPSIQVHACHGPARQAEVLRDVILGLLEDDPTLQPRDVLVMTPDLDAYAPLLRAAFLGGPDLPELPLEVADLHVARANPVADALLAILGLAAGRAGASEVLEVLGREPVRTRFGIDADALAQISRWVVDAGIRWGADADHRAREGQPREGVHTWRFGLDRLLLGVAMADEDHRVVGGVTPYDHVEGDEVTLVGRLAAACDALFSIVEVCRDPRPLGGWMDLLADLLDRCLSTEDPGARHEVRVALEELRAAMVGDGEGDVVLDLGAARLLVERALATERGAAGYETGAITLCALAPMRSIPHRVVCLVGLDDDAFPRGQQRPGFDLTDRDHRAGDRTPRDEDRFLFLEAVLAARDNLVVTTTGRDVRTNERRPPAVPLAELLDVLDRMVPPGATRRAHAWVTVEHPLQPFSPHAFGAPRPGRDGDDVRRPVSFDPVMRDAAQRSRGMVREPFKFVPGELPGAADEPPGAIDLDELILAASHPTRLLLERRLGLGLGEWVTIADDRVPVELDALSFSGLARDLLARGHADPAAWTAATLAGGTVPIGTAGTLGLDEVAAEVAGLTRAARELLGEGGVVAATAAWPMGAHVPPTVGRELDVGLDTEGTRVRGVVGGLLVAPGATVRLLLDAVRPRPDRLLRAWITHLVLVAASDEPATSVVVLRSRSGRAGEPTRHVLRPLDPDPAEARAVAIALLGDLADLHRQARHRLLPLFPNASAAYAESGSMTRAERDFLPGYLGWGGDVDGYVTQAYGPEPTLADVLRDPAAIEEFQRLARRVWEPLLRHTGQHEATPAGRS